MRKILAVILCFMLVFGVFPIGIAAEENDEGWKNVLLQALYEVETDRIDLSQYNVSRDRVYEFLGYDIYYHYPEIQYYYDGVDTSSLTYKPGSKNVAKLKLTYKYDKATIKEKQREVSAAIEPAVNGVDREWSELQKALYLHDWLCVNFMYDTRLWSDCGSENYDIYNFFKDGMGVCQAYTFAYMYLLRQFNIDSYFVLSLEDNHGWNVVEIEGNWYHIDVTHDDPLLDRYTQTDFLGRAEHNHFMLSDSELASCCELHSNWECPLRDDITCKSYKGNVYWKNVFTQFIPIGDYWYYVDYVKGGLMRSENFRDEVRIAEIGKKFNEGDEHYWMITGSSGIPSYFTGLSEMNEHLFFSDSTTVYVYDTHFGIVNMVFQLDSKQAERLYGFKINNKTIEYVIFDYLGHNGIFDNNTHIGMYKLDKHLIKTDWIVVKQPTETQYGERIKRCFICGEVLELQTLSALGGDKYLGDCDGDGKINTSDLAIMKLFLSGNYGAVSNYADFDKDGKIDVNDLALIKLKLADVLILKEVYLNV